MLTEIKNTITDVLGRTNKKYKQLVKRIRATVDAIKMFFDVNKKKTIYETISFIIVYGAALNLALYLVLGYQISILNLLASGATYYLFVDVIGLLSEHGFILFKERFK